MTTVALIPSYQPDERLTDLLSALRARGMEGVVIDDGSGMQYRGIFSEASRFATVIGYETNQGKGHALKRGLSYIHDHFDDDTVVVTVDADGQHDVDDVVYCASVAKQAQDAIVLGCRNFSAADIPLRSRLGNTITCGVYRLASGLHVSDTQTGLRAFSAALIDFLVGIGGERYEYEMNVLLACPPNHVEIREVPIRTIYEDNNAGSHFRTVQDSVRIYAGILSFMASSFASLLVDYALFGLLSGLLASFGGAGLAVANVGARIVSATVNFLVNRNLVFHSTDSLYVSAVRYGMLAAGLLMLNTLGILTLVRLLGMPALAAKFLVEASLFVMSWVAQNRVVFGGEERAWA